MTALGLTYRQKDVLRFVKQHMDAGGGVSPSFDEIRLGVGLTSKSQVHGLVTALEERGFIRRLPNRARSIVVVEQAAA